MSLFRKFDLRYNSNLAAIGLSAVAFVVGVGVGVADGEVGEALADGLNLMVTVFLGWAVARELEPDRDATATVAALLAGVMWLIMGRSALAAGVAALLAARILTRSTGRPLTNVDYLLVVALAFYGARTLAGWMAGLGMAFALARDVRLPGPAPKHQRMVAFGAAAAATAGLLILRPAIDPEWSLAAIVAVIAGVIAGLILPDPRPSAPTDTGNEVMSPARILSARRTSLVVAIFGALTGTVGVAGLAPVWSALIAVPLVDLSRRRRGRGRDAGPAAAAAPSIPPDEDSPGAI